MKFPVPHDVKAQTIPGTEGWERMYPYQYQFVTDDPVRNQYEKETFWFYDGLHYPEPLYPFDTIWDEAWYLALSQFNNRVFMVPPVRGVDHRMINGFVYISPVPVKDPAEIGSRVPHFMERAGHYYKNWDALEAKWKVKMEATIRELDAIQIPRLAEMEDISVVMDAVGESKGYHLLKNYDDLINLGIKCWQYHFEFLNLGYAAYVFFLDFVQKQFPSIPAQRVTQMISGIDVIMYRPDEELKGLARKAIELGVEALVTSSTEWTVVEAALKAQPKGVEWLTSLNLSREPWFNVSTGTGWFHHDRSWNDQMNVPLSGIATYIGKLKQGVNIERPREKVCAERDRVPLRREPPVLRRALVPFGVLEQDARSRRHHAGARRHQGRGRRVAAAPRRNQVGLVGHRYRLGYGRDAARHAYLAARDRMAQGRDAEIQGMEPATSHRHRP